MKQVNILVVATQPHLPDVRGVALQRTLQDDLHLRLDEVHTARCILSMPRSRF
jgi:hypothetical protein